MITLEANYNKKIGLSHMTLFRIEKGEHHLTLNKLKIRLSNVFPEEF